VFKYERVETLSRPLSKLLLQALPTDLQFDVVVPMPIHWRKRWSRGFNQAELLARPIARRYGVPFERSLRKSRRTAPQASLTEAQRRDNLRDSFAVAESGKIRGRRVLLVDDVYTTGASVRAAAAVLKAAGAACVIASTLARADRKVPLRGNVL
jgi:ComF family protein